MDLYFTINVKGCVSTEVPFQLWRSVIARGSSDFLRFGNAPNMPILQIQTSIYRLKTWALGVVIHFRNGVVANSTLFNTLKFARGYKNMNVILVEPLAGLVRLRRSGLPEVFMFSSPVLFTSSCFPPFYKVTPVSALYENGDFILMNNNHHKSITYTDD